MNFLRNIRRDRRRVWGLAAALVLGACGDNGLPETARPAGDEQLETATTAQPLAFSSPMDFSELRGLPAAPASMDTTVSELLAVLPDPRFADLRGVLQTRHQPTDKVRLLTSYARDYPVFLKGHQALLPQADGVISAQSPVVTWQTLASNACSSTHACANLFEPTQQDTGTLDHKVIVIVAPLVELAAPVQTGGATLVVASGGFTSRGFSVRTTPGARTPQQDADPMDRVVPPGRDGLNGGSFVLYTNVLNGVRVTTSGQKGEDGWTGVDATGSPPTTTITGNYGPDPKVSCSGTPTAQAGHGSNGGKGGHSGDVVIRYTSLIGPGVVNEPHKASPITPEQCFQDEDGPCHSLKCRWNPAIALCDSRTEADNTQCSDGKDNDLNGYTDCEDYACSKNPHVTVCADASWGPIQREASAESCSDGKDNDNDGKTDCLDPECSQRGFCQQSRAANSEFSEEACQDGHDNDGDGFVDCADFGCKNFATTCGTAGEGGDEECTDLIDNDGDGLGDCADPGCHGNAYCGLGPVLLLTTGLEETNDAACSDGTDNDVDGDVDCADKECRYNPRVLNACGSERTVLNCSDGIDNDGDGKVDCQDPGCAGNPYVKVCEPDTYPFLQEATAATCSDGVDNDGDYYSDCSDFQCSNSPLAGNVCGAQENTFAQCTDGLDNDNDGYKDCSDSTCRNSPFFGDLACRNQIQTWHDVSLGDSYNGRYVDTRAELVTTAPLSGKKGIAGKRLSRTVQVVVQEAPPGSCEHYDDYLCVPRDETRTCYVGTKANDGVAGAAGTAGTQKVLRSMRRDVDMLRALLAPQSWRVSQSHANALFKRGELQRAGFHYLQNIMEMGGILAQAGLVCDETPAAGRPFADLYLYGSLCPLMAHDVTRLSFLQSQRNFYGLAKDTPFNPHLRYEQLRAEFDSLYDVLDSSVNQWLTLANGTQLSAWMSQNQAALNADVGVLEAEKVVADQRITVANASMAALQQSMNNRKAAIQLMTENIQATDQRITDHYNTSKGFGEFLLDLVGTVAAAYGGEFLADLAGKAAESLWSEVKKSFQSESSGTPVAGAGAPSSESGSIQTLLWDAIKTSAANAAASKPFKDKLKSGGTELWDIVSGNQKKPARSIISDEVKKEILSQSQVEMTLDLMDLQAQVTKAQAEYRLALMERDMVTLRQRNSVAARDALNDILAFGNGTELRKFDQLLIGQQVYARALRTLDQLSIRYWELIRVAEYQYLPFDASTGDSAIPATFRENYDFNLANYPDMKTRLVQHLDSLPTHTVMSLTPYYRRLAATDFHPLTVNESERMKALGDLVTAGTTYRAARFQVTPTDVSASTVLSLRKGHRVRNVRVNVVTATGASVSVPAVLVRDTMDGFKLGNYFAEFELVDRDEYTSGGTRQVLHYVPFTACVSGPPACDVADPACSTPFQGAAFTDACSVAPGGSTPANNSFYDRSLLGEWTLLIDTASFTGLGDVRAAEVVFMTAGITI
ncbi:hypothetical protein OWM54_35405 [Myxococcus sp. MISCRS1]|uniref:hypothetical protein n=1 Tax=unclassified Myxococcus TaxID=2648731 RepID=UPI001CBE193C|nr:MULTISPECIES: hypothetical protein [unclassified Myxococcus]MBZ4398990.1 hypothetical protein [Myxococcus sp. AS-1-15]MCY1002455.1 hypothetical protein [Myxococcus sp. MISCRS1]BDT35977.1 hypothetical protein MFMH1_56460 [Myxococcus sp. MH1]